MKNKIIVLLIACAVFFLSLHPVTDHDSYLDVKAGQIILSTGNIPKMDPFSFSAGNRTWVIHEPLAFLIFAVLVNIGGFGLLSVFVAALTSFYFFLLYFLFRRIFDLAETPSLIIALAVVSFIAEFFVARAQILGYLFFLTTLFVILLYSFKGKNFLSYLGPVFYLWSKSHASFFLASVIVLMYLAIEIILAVFKKTELKKIRNLTILLFLSILIPLLPPNGIEIYKLLTSFAKDFGFISRYINEWSPLSTNSTHYFVYTIVSVAATATFIFSFLKERSIKKLILMIPLAAIMVFGTMARRNYPLGLTASFLLIGASFSTFVNLKENGRVVKIITVFIVFGLFIFLRTKIIDNFNEWRLPKQGVGFLKQYKLNGRMFNDMDIGGYLDYYLTPEYKVFFDGRFELFGDREMRDFAEVLANKKTGRNEFSETLKSFFKKYDFSSAVLTVNSYNPLEENVVKRIGDVLLDDPKWVLIYFDDHVQILVKRDGKNDNLIKKYGFTRLSPFRFTFFKFKTPDGSVERLQNLVKNYDSGIAETIIGFRKLEVKDQKTAETSFKKAITLNPYLGQPYLGLGMINIARGNNRQAEKELLQAVDISPYLGQAFLELSGLYEKQGQADAAVDILEKSLVQNLDFLSRQKIVQTLNRLYSERPKN